MSALDRAIPRAVTRLALKLKEIRESRVPVTDKLTSLCSQRLSGNAPDGDLVDQILAAERELAEIDIKIGDQLHLLAKERDLAAADYRRALLGELANAKLHPGLSAAVEAIDAAREIFHAAHRHAARNGFTPAEFLGALPRIDALKALLHKF
jgi:hypothetical protein